MSRTRSATSTGSSSGRPRSTSRSSSSAASAHAVAPWPSSTPRVTMRAEPRVHRQIGHGTPRRGDASRGVDRAQLGEQGLGLVERGGRRRGGEGELVRRCAPPGQFEREAGEVDAGDLGRGERGSRRVLVLRPQPDGDARLGPSGTAGALFCRCSRVGHGLEPREPGARVVAGGAHLTAVDHHPHAGHREARLGDVGRQHDPTSTGRRGREGCVLLGDRQRPEQGSHIHIVGHRGRGAGRPPVRCRRPRRGTPARRPLRSRGRRARRPRRRGPVAPGGRVVANGSQRERPALPISPSARRPRLRSALRSDPCRWSPTWRAAGGRDAGPIGRRASARARCRTGGIARGSRRRSRARRRRARGRVGSAGRGCPRSPPRPGSTARRVVRRGSGTRRSRRRPRRATPPCVAPRPAPPTAAARARRCAALASPHPPAIPRPAAGVARWSSCRRRAEPAGPPLRDPRARREWARCNPRRGGRSTPTLTVAPTLSTARDRMLAACGWSRHRRAAIASAS